MKHFPPEWLQLRSCYDSIMLNGWDFIYIDSLGVLNTSLHTNELLNSEPSQVLHLSASNLPSSFVN
jgi:hypothetical protein